MQLWGQYNKNGSLNAPVSFGVPGGIRTPDLLVRSQSLYPAELQAHPPTKYIISQNVQSVKLIRENCLNAQKSTVKFVFD